MASGGKNTFAATGQRIAGIAFDHPLGLRWWIAFGLSLGLAGLLGVAVVYILIAGVGVWATTSLSPGHSTS